MFVILNDGVAEELPLNPISYYLSRTDGTPEGWINEYLSFGGFEEIHDIVPYYEINPESKVYDVVTDSKKRKLEKIVNDSINEFGKSVNAKSLREVREFFEDISRWCGTTGVPNNLNLSINGQLPKAARIQTLNKYLSLLSDYGFLHRVEIFDPKNGTAKKKLATYYFTDIGFLQVLNDYRVKEALLLRTVICNHLVSISCPFARAQFSTFGRDDRGKNMRISKSVDFVSDEFSIQVVPSKYHEEDVREACHAMKLLGRNINIIVTAKEKVEEFRQFCPENIEVMDIITLLSR